MSLVLGVDPGLSGALALVDLKPEQMHDRRLHKVIDMPKTVRGSKNQVDIYSLAHSLDAHAREIAFAVVEDVGAMTYTDAKGQKRGQGAAASFAFGQYSGVVLGILASYSIPIYFVKPSVWKMAYGLSSNKGRSLDLARERWPSFTSSFELKKHDGRAEAALLALFGAERFK